MNELQQRLLMFLFGCIGVRSLFFIIAKYIDPKYLKYLGYLALLPATGFLYIFLTGSRKTGPEVFGEKIWWNDLRPLHSLLYFLFAYNAIMGNKNSNPVPPRFQSQGGTMTEDLALQNIQARVRMVVSYMLAQLLPWLRSCGGNTSSCSGGWLLVLGSA